MLTSSASRRNAAGSNVAGASHPATRVDPKSGRIFMTAGCRRRCFATVDRRDPETIQLDEDVVGGVGTVTRVLTTGRRCAKVRPGLTSWGTPGGISTSR